MKTLPALLPLLMSASLISGDSTAQQLSRSDTAPQDPRIVEAIEEIDLALNAYFELIDEKKLDRFISGVTHAARARLLLEQYLGEDTDNYSFELARRESCRHSLIMIASHARKFTGEEAREMWIQDPGYDYYANAKHRLAELDVMVKGFKKHYLVSEPCLEQSKP